MGELLSFSQNQRNTESRFVFKGKSCYPISPNSEGDNVVNNQDQVIKILERYPELDVSKDFSFTTSINTTNYLSNIASKIKLKDSLKKRFSKSNPVIVSFLEQILELNPFLRPTAKQLLSNPIFN